METIYPGYGITGWFSLTGFWTYVITEVIDTGNSEQHYSLMA